MMVPAGLVSPEASAQLDSGLCLSSHSFSPVLHSSSVSSYKDNGTGSWIFNIGIGKVGTTHPIMYLNFLFFKKFLKL
jgi:hypothetical protein